MGAIRNFIGSKVLSKEAWRGDKARMPPVLSTTAVGGAVIDGYLTTQADQMENPENSQAMSTAKGAATAAGWLFAEPLMWGIALGQGAVAGTKMAFEEAKEQESIKYGIKGQTKKDQTGSFAGTIGGDFMDSEQAYTMRQRQSELLRSHKMSTESVLGSEARQLHR